MKFTCLVDESREVAQLSDCLTMEWAFIYLLYVCMCVLVSCQPQTQLLKVQSYN